MSNQVSIRKLSIRVLRDLGDAGFTTEQVEEMSFDSIVEAWCNYNGFINYGSTISAAILNINEAFNSEGK